MKHRKISALLTIAALVLGCSTAAYAEATPETAVLPAQAAAAADVQGEEAAPESTAASDATEALDTYSDAQYMGTLYSWLAPDEYNIKLYYVIKPDNTIAIVYAHIANYDLRDPSLCALGFYAPSSIDGHPVTEIAGFHEYSWDGYSTGYFYLGDSVYTQDNPFQVILPDSLTTISTPNFIPYMVEGYVGSITLPNSVTSISENCFKDRRIAGDFVFSSGLKVIPKNTLASTKISGSVTIPEGIETIGERAFECVSTGGDLIIPDSVKTIENDAFSSARVDGTIKFGKGLETLGENAFRHSSLSGMVNLPESLKTIGDCAFMQCDITGIYIPASVTSIGEDVFYYSNPTIYGESGSYAEQYAKENNIPFVDKTAEISAFVERLYTVALDRASDADGKAYWVDKLKHNTATGSEVAFGFIASDEMKNRGLSDSEFVTVLYKTFFDREADEAGLKYWVDMLANGMSRDYVTCGFTGSTEFDTLCTSFGITRGSVSSSQARDKNANLTAFVNRLYVKLLDRSGEEDGLNHWCAAILDKTRTPQQVAQGFVFSDEFMNKNYSDEVFIEYMYRTFLGRDSEQAGKDYWLGQVSQGATREQLFEGFANSAEFAGIVASFGL